MLDLTEKQELNEMNNDNLVYETVSNLSKNAFSEQLLNGGGNRMIEYLKDPPKANRIKILKFKVENLFKRIFEVL